LKIFHILKYFSFTLLICCLLFLSNCKSYDQMRITKAPKPQIIAKASKPKIMPAGYLKLQIRKQLPEIEEVIISDQHYVYITKEWFLEMNSWTENFIHEQAPQLKHSANLPAGYRETYIMFMSAIANLEIAKHYNVKSSALIGILVAKNVVPWEAIPATGKHMSYAVVLSDNSVMVYDIVTKQLCDIYDFPNLKHTREIVF